MKRDFKGVWIPAEIWLSKELSLQEKVFLAEIDSLDNEDGCFASNKYFAEFFGLTTGRCSQIITSLKNKGFLSIELVYGDKQEIEKRIIKVLNKLNTPIKKIKGGVKDIKAPYLENDEDNNTSINNPINNTNIYIRQLFDYWNSKKIIEHRKMNKQMESHINARLQEYEFEELKKAIDNYAAILADDNKYYWTHKWTLQQFMKPDNVSRFTDDADPMNNFIKNDYKQNKQSDPFSNGMMYSNEDDYDYGF